MLDRTEIVAGVVGLVAGVVLGRMSKRSGENAITLGAPVIDGPIDPRIAELVKSGRKIDAVKLYRQLYRVDLRQAKDAVDALG